MKDKQKIFPILSLTALLAVSSISGYHFSFNNKYNVNNTYKSDDIFTEDGISQNYEANMEDLVDCSYFVPQGLTFSDSYSFISFYDYSKHNKSIIRCFLQDGTLVNTFSLANDSHVGGISFDEVHDLLWVCSTNGEVDAYRLDDVISKDSSLPCYSGLKVGSGLPNYTNPFVNSVSYLTVFNGDLYVGNFSIYDKGNVKKYSIIVDDDRRVILKLLDSFKVPSMVQGLAFYEHDENTYLILSRSFGCGKASALQIFKYKENVKDYTKPIVHSKTFEFPSMMEQIEVFDNYLYSLYEYESKIYGGKSDNEYILRISNMDEVIK